MRHPTSGVSWFLLTAPLLFCAIAVTAPRIRAEQPVTADAVLRLAGDYVHRYERSLSAVIAQEDYRQSLLTAPFTRAVGSWSRKTRASLLVLDAGPLGWLSFRDVFEVDGKVVREHDDRLARLFAEGGPDSLAHARRIALESARFNLNPPGVTLDRTINTPMTALMFLRSELQSRSVFQLEKTERVDGLTCVSLGFDEQSQPRVIASGDSAASHGLFLIDVAQGRVLASELRLETGLPNGLSVRSEIKVKYEYVGRLDLWLPAEMKETYEFRPSGHVIGGIAKYSDYRQFSVTTSEDIR